MTKFVLKTLGVITLKDLFNANATLVSLEAVVHVLTSTNALATGYTDTRMYEQDSMNRSFTLNYFFV